jgi:hypothetical protein
MPAATDAKEAFADNWSGGVRSLIDSASLFWLRKEYRTEQPLTPQLSSDLLEVRAAEAVANRNNTIDAAIASIPRND